MHNRILYATLSLFLILYILPGCSDHYSVSHEESNIANSPSSKTKEEISEVTDRPAGTSAESAPENSVTGRISAAETSNAESEQVPETLPKENSQTKETTGITKPNERQNSSVQLPDITAISATLQNYISLNEESPYPKGESIYKILYNGSCAQVGDTLTFNLSVTPVKNSGKINVDATDNLSYLLSDTTLMVTINSVGDFDMGRVMLYGMSSDGRTISAKCSVSFVVDKAENPYNNLPTVFGEYIRKCGMQFSSVSSGYTASDPSLSITHYAHAPAWDDMIDRSRQDYLSKCLWLIDEYAMRGFRKVNFIITETEIGFSAST